MANVDMHICSVCVLPESFPGITFNNDGICNFCQEARNEMTPSERFKLLQEEMSLAIETRRKFNQNDYDCIVAYSGGKDSTYTLKLLVEKYRLRCLAVTLNNGFMSEQARENCEVITSTLGVDYLVIKPATSFMRNMYLESVKNTEIHAESAIKRASNICNSCINLINVQMIRVALQHGVSIIAGGYIGGQVPKDAAKLELDLAVLMKSREKMQSKFISSFGTEAQYYMQIPQSLIMRSNINNILIINPLLTVLSSEDEIITSISKLGWKKTIDTGRNSSNCRLNDLGIAIHYRQRGFNPYVFEISEQVRNGQLDRLVALEKVSTIPSFSDLTWQATTIGLKLDEY